MKSFSQTKGGRQAIELAAEFAAVRLCECGPRGNTDVLEAWESVTQYGDYTITVRCDYKKRDK